MTDLQTQSRAIAYLAPSVDSFWRWSDDGQVLTWIDGKTIAFREEVEAVLARLAPGGLPPLGGVALLLAACRDGWEESGWRETVVGYAGVFERWQAGLSSPKSPPAFRHVFQRIAAHVSAITEGLDAVNRLRPELRQGAAAKAVLAELVFEPAEKALPPEQAAAVVRVLSDGVSPESLRPALSDKEPLAVFAEDVDCLRVGLPRVNEQALELRARTGLDQPVQPADLDLAPSERVRRLLAELRKDAELSGLAKLAQDLMAAVHVPRALHAREELPLGGVSDLSNRGPLDRLLLSELAHDDLTLAVRVAVNEALYLRRESPPRSPPSRRAILLDCGIRLWGVPRVFAAAAALALAATADKRSELRVFRPTPRGVEPVDVLTREGLLKALEGLEPSPQPGHALGPFLAALAEKQGDPAAQTDAVVVTHRDVLSDSDFTAALTALENPDLYLAAVARDGLFRLFASGAAGRKLVREAVLSLDALLAPPKRPAAPPPTPVVAEGSDPNLPVILSAKPFPLRLPCVVGGRTAAGSARHGLVAVSGDGRLLHWDGERFGARQLTDRVPRGKVHGIFFDEDEGSGKAHAVIGAEGGKTLLLTADLETTACRTSGLRASGPNPLAAGVRSGFLFLVHHRVVDAFNLTTGLQTGRLELPEDVYWQSGRFFVRRGPDRQYSALAFDGRGRARLERVPAAGSVIALFDRGGADGPWSLSAPQVVTDLATGSVEPVDAGSLGGNAREVLLEQVSADGRFLAVRTAGQSVKGVHWVDLDDGRGWRIVPDDADALDVLMTPQLAWSRRCPVSVRSFDNLFLGGGGGGVYVNGAGNLALVDDAGHCLAVGLSEAGDLILMEHGRDPNRPPRPRPLEPVNGPARALYRLALAKWGDGSRAWLDSRGMLHLKSSDPAVPHEITLVLSNGKLAGWSSGGQRCGPDFFHGPDVPVATAVSGRRFYEEIRRFIARLR